MYKRTWTSFIYLAGRIGNSNDKMTRKAIKTVMANCYIGDWFVLYQISKNVNMYFFRAFMKELQYDLKPKSRNFEKKTSLPDYQSVAKVEEDTKSRVFLLPINVACNRFFFLQTYSLFQFIFHCDVIPSLWNIVSQYTACNFSMSIHNLLWYDLRFNTYRKVASRSTSRLVARPRIFRLFMKEKFDAYVL